MSWRISNNQYRVAAAKKWEKEGEIEIDSDAEVSRSADNGAYVQAWVWISDDDIPRRSVKGLNITPSS
jgi:hypothetical protein